MGCGRVRVLVPAAGCGTCTEFTYGNRERHVGAAMNINNLTVSTIVAEMATLLALGGGTVQAATLCVNPRGTGTCFSSIQAAVDAAHDGDTIKVAPGTYAEQVMIDGKSVTIRGAGNGTIIRPSAPATLTSIYTYPAAGVFWPSAI